MKETDLYPPVREHLTAEGYEVYAEVKGCDVVGLKQDDFIVVELKTSLNLTLLRQAVDRQKLTNNVYIAIPEPARVTRSIRTSQQIIKRLGLGLITVSHSPLRDVAAEKFPPEYSGRQNKRLRNNIFKEVAGRTVDLNQGGATRTTIYTAYRETAFALAWMISECGEPMRVKDLKPAAGNKTQSILYRNHYGWFTRVGLGTYDLTEEGQAALSEHPDLAAIAERTLSNR